jgi:hypothetical protein
VLVFSARAVGNQEFVTFLLPRSVDAPKVQIRETEAHGGRAFEVWDGAVRDLLLIGSGQRIEAKGIASDFHWTWARHASTPGAPRELVLLDGSFLSLEGRDILRASAPVSWLVIRYLGEKVIIETDASVDLNLEPLGARPVTLNGGTVASERQGSLIAG